MPNSWHRSCIGVTFFFFSTLQVSNVIVREFNHTSLLGPGHLIQVDSWSEFAVHFWGRDATACDRQDLIGKVPATADAVLAGRLMFRLASCQRTARVCIYGKSSRLSVLGISPQFTGYVTINLRNVIIYINPMFSFLGRWVTDGW
jgi:hypothetical protein